MVFPVQLQIEHAEQAALVMRVSFDDRLPWLAGLHTLDEDTNFFREHVFRKCSVWGAYRESVLVGLIAFQSGWIDQLYILPGHQRHGVGASLLSVAKAASNELSLWTFQRNDPAKQFYEKHGFVAVEATDGSNNEEKEPDVRYRWCLEVD